MAHLPGSRLLQPRPNGVSDIVADEGQLSPTAIFEQKRRRSPLGFSDSVDISPGIPSASSQIRRDERFVGQLNTRHETFDNAAQSKYHGRAGESYRHSVPPTVPVSRDGTGPKQSSEADKQRHH